MTCVTRRAHPPATRPPTPRAPRYYKSEADRGRHAALGYIMLTESCLVCRTPHCGILLETPAREWHFKAKANEEVDGWVAALRAQIARAALDEMC